MLTSLGGHNQFIAKSEAAFIHSLCECFLSTYYVLSSHHTGKDNLSSCPAQPSTRVVREGTEKCFADGHVSGSARGVAEQAPAGSRQGPVI